MPTATATRTGTFLGVELVRVGDWPASQGNGKVTAEDIASMVAASTHPMANRIPIKIGHTDSRFQDANGNPPEDQDGNPAYGRVENLRASDDGLTLIGDLVHVPPQLAEAMPSMYPDRSVEYLPGKRLGEKVHRAVLTALAVLGESPPAVKGLKDLIASFAAQLETPVALHIVDDTPMVQHSQRIPADGARDSKSHIHGGTVAISLAVRKALELADNATDEQINAALTAAGLSVLPVTPAEPAPADPAAPAATSPTTGAPVVEPAPAAALPAAPEPLPVAASASPDVITVDRVSFSALQADAQAGRHARNEQIAVHRDHLVNVAFREGRIHPTVVSHYRAMLDKDETSTAALLTALPAVLPVNEVGHGGTGTNLSADDSKAADERAINTFIRR